MRFSRKMVLSGVLAMTLGNLGFAASVTNGNFEAGFNGASSSSDYKYLYDGDSTSIQGWTAHDDGIEEPSYIMFKTPRYQDIIAEGNFAVFLNAGTSLSTTVSLVAGQAYSLSYFAKAVFRVLPDPLEIVIGARAFNVGDPGGYTRLNFVADVTSASTMLSFKNVSPSSGVRGYAIDDIAISAVTAAVPEPESLALVGLGLLSLLIQRSRFTKR